KYPWLVHVGSGLPHLGERRPEKLLALLPEGVPYVGVGVGKRWNRELMKRAAEKSAGLLAHVNPDEPVAWRTFELLATLNTPRLLDVRVTDPEKKLTFLTDSSQLAQGEELFAVARTEGGRPEKVVVSGTLDGMSFERSLTVEQVAGGALYLPRTWGRLEVALLLAADPQEHKDR